MMNFIETFDGQLGLLQQQLTINRESNATPLNGNLINGDSDGDSGIVALGPTRIGSSSSNDTDPDLNLAFKYTPQSSSVVNSSSSSVSSINRDLIGTVGSFNLEKRKPIFQRVRFDDQHQLLSSQPSITDFTLRKSFRELFNSPNLMTNGQPETSKSSIPVSSSSSLLATIPGSPSTANGPVKAFPTKTTSQSLSQRRLTVPSPLTIDPHPQTASKPSPTANLKSNPMRTKSTYSTNNMTTSKGSIVDRSWSTLPRNNKINGNLKCSNTINTIQNNKPSNHDSNLILPPKTIPLNEIGLKGKRKSFIEKPLTAKPDLIESHSVNLSSSVSNSSKSLTKTTIATTKSTISQSPIPKSRSCTTLNGLSKEKMISTTESSSPSTTAPNGGEPKMSKLCTIDPLESTGSMVCAFASVASVIFDESTINAGSKKVSSSLDKEVAAAVAAVQFATKATPSTSSSPLLRSASSAQATETIKSRYHQPKAQSNGTYKNSHFRHSIGPATRDPSESDHFYANTRTTKRLSAHLDHLRSGNGYRTDRTVDPERDYTNSNVISEFLDHQYEAIFPSGKPNSNCSDLDGGSSSSSTTNGLGMESGSACRSSVPLERLIKSNGTIDFNSVESKLNQSTTNIKESEPSRNQRSIQSQLNNNNNQHDNNRTRNNSVQQCSHPRPPQQQQQSLEPQHEPSHHIDDNPVTLNEEDINPISTGIRYKSILKRSSTSSPNWPSIHLADEGELTGAREDDGDGENDNLCQQNDEDNHEQVEDNNEPESSSSSGRKVDEEGNSVGEVVAVGGGDDEEEEDKVVQNGEDEEEDNNAPMAEQINVPCFVASSLIKSPSSPLLHSSSSSSVSLRSQHHHLAYRAHNGQLIANYQMPGHPYSKDNCDGGGGQSFNRLSLIDNPNEVAYLQPDQIYPRPKTKLNKSLTLSSMAMAPTTPSQAVPATPTGTSLKSSHSFNGKTDSPLLLSPTPCEVEYAIITKSMNRRNEMINQTIQSQLNGPSYHHRQQHQQFNQPNHQQNRHFVYPEPVEVKPLTTPTTAVTAPTTLTVTGTGTTTNHSPVVKMTRFALDEADAVAHNRHLIKCSSSPTTLATSSSHGKWFTKRIGGLKKAISRAFSTDRLPRENGPQHQSSEAELIPSQQSSSSSRFTSSSSTDHRVNQITSAVNQCKPINISSSKSTPNLNCKTSQLTNSSRSRNHSTEDLAHDLKSFVKSVKNRMSFRRKDKETTKSNQKNAKNDHKSTNQRSFSAIKSSEDQSHHHHSQAQSQFNWNRSSTKEEVNRDELTTEPLLWGELIELRSDGSQVIELNRSQNRPFGFFLARGTVNHVKGVFVTRMRDEQTQTILTGLLEIGDEIVAIDGLDVKSHTNIGQVNQLMSIKRKIVLTVKPYINQHH